MQLLLPAQNKVTSVSTTTTPPYQEVSADTVPNSQTLAKFQTFPAASLCSFLTQHTSCI